MGFRVTKEEEFVGLDQVFHAESAYPETLSADELPSVFRNGTKVGIIDSEKTDLSALDVGRNSDSYPLCVVYC